MIIKAFNIIICELFGQQFIRSPPSHWLRPQIREAVDNIVNQQHGTQRKASKTNLARIHCPSA